MMAIEICARRRPAQAFRAFFVLFLSFDNGQPLHSTVASLNCWAPDSAFEQCVLKKVQLHVSFESRIWPTLVTGNSGMEPLCLPCFPAWRGPWSVQSTSATSLIHAQSPCLPAVRANVMSCANNWQVQGAMPTGRMPPIFPMPTHCTWLPSPLPLDLRA
jgi:hypothetical protein